MLTFLFQSLSFLKSEKNIIGTQVIIYITSQSNCQPLVQIKVPKSKKVKRKEEKQDKVFQAPTGMTPDAAQSKEIFKKLCTGNLWSNIVMSVCDLGKLLVKSNKSGF